MELQINVGAKRGDDNLYLVDLKYVGLFEIENLTDDIKEAYLLVSVQEYFFHLQDVLFMIYTLMVLYHH